MGTILLVVFAGFMLIILISWLGSSSKTKSPTHRTETVPLKEMGFDMYETFNLTKLHVTGRHKYISNFCKENDQLEIRRDSSFSVVHKDNVIGNIADPDVDEVRKYMSHDHKAGIRKITYPGGAVNVEIMIAYKSEDHPSEEGGSLKEKTIFVEKEPEPTFSRDTISVIETSGFNLVIDDEKESGKEYYVETFELTGVHIPKRKNYLLNYCEEYDQVTLQHEEKNPASKRAIAVKHENKLIGYISEADLDDVHKFLDRISQAFISAIDYDGKRLDVEIEIEYEIPSRKRKPKPKTKRQEESELHPEDFMRFAQNKIPTEYLKPQKDLEDTGSFFYGKKVCISGTLENFPYRAELAKHFWDIGADVDGSVGKTCDILIKGEGVGPSKLKQAKEQGVLVMDETQLIEKLNGFKSRFH